MDMDEKISYKDAKKELEEIVSEIESGDLDVDLLADKVKRASELLKLCRDKLSKTDEELQKLLDNIEEDA